MPERPAHLRDTDKDCLARLNVPGPPVVCELEKHDDDVLHRNGPALWGEVHSVRG